jgi:ribosomal protein L11 methyltransferase
MPASPTTRQRAAKTWHKIIISVSPSMSEAATAYLANLSGTGLEISADEYVEQETGNNRLGREKITAYLSLASPDDAGKVAAQQVHEIEEFLVTLLPLFPECLPPHIQSEIIHEEDWGKQWKRFFTSFQVTPSLTIRPSWEKGSRNRGKEKHHVIVMDPGLAFGTGHHASTQLALLLLEQIFMERGDSKIRVLDLGTGSGILAMASALFGTGEVVALDNDPDAVETAQQNICRNRLSDRVTVSDLPVTVLEGEFHIITANITHDILAGLAERLSYLLVPNGFLILSGILAGDQERSIRRIYTEVGLHFIQRRSKAEWAALLFQK